VEGRTRRTDKPTVKMECEGRKKRLKKKAALADHGIALVCVFAFGESLGQEACYLGGRERYDGAQLAGEHGAFSLEPTEAPVFRP
jgi:hypothetical protein